MNENPTAPPDPVKEHTEHTAEFIRAEETAKAAKKAKEVGAVEHRTVHVRASGDEYIASCSCGWRMSVIGSESAVIECARHEQEAKS